MNNFTGISNTSLVLASLLLLISIFFSYYQKLHLEKEIIISIIRAVIQLLVIGYILTFIFSVDSPYFTALLLLSMITNAAYNAKKRGEGIKNAFLISFIAVLFGACITLGILVLTKSLKFTAYQVIPVGGMITGNAMVAVGLCYRQLKSNFDSRREEVEAKLSLGADIKNASLEIIRNSIKTGMVPTIDSAKTLGIVSLPGMMTGLILAGTPPLLAIRYQIMVTFMLMSTTSIASFTACYLAYKGFYNEYMQLKR